ncbi:hypothetical protein [Streptomyces jumonjinensis]|uniref:hypothetical protein n=1 Tax=Streptomyces jumonjinensis TaxID=1945 RepID=UPI0037BC8086
MTRREPDVRPAAREDTARSVRTLGEAFAGPPATRCGVAPDGRTDRVTALL